MLSELVAAGLVTENAPLANFTTYKIGGSARWYAEPNSVEDLRSLAEVDSPILVIGRGSNLVVADQGFPGLVIRLGKAFADVSVEGETVVAGGSAALPNVARTAARASLAGLGWMVGVPGSVGGAVRMNAGCFGADTAECLETADVFDTLGRTVATRQASTFAFQYRRSNVAPHEVVINARFRCEPGDQTELETEMRSITRWRKEHQPGGTHNAGSVFKNPPDDAAGRIIDDAGLKGLQVGAVHVSHKHANFFVAERGARAEDVRGLVAEVQRRVHETAGILLEPEMVFVGFDDDGY